MANIEAVEVAAAERAGPGWAAVGAPSPAARRGRGGLARFVRSSPLGTIALAFLVVVLVLALLADVITYWDPLLTNYGSALAEFTSDKLKVFPTKVDATADHATVRTEIKRDSGDRFAVNYPMLKKTDGWKAYDVNIDGISYVKSYREDFGSQIAQQGIDSVIARLERGEKPSEISKTTKATGSKS